MNNNALTGYPSIDKPWNRYFNSVDGGEPFEMPTESIYDYYLKHTKNCQDFPALEYFGNRISYAELTERIESLSKALVNSGVKAGDVVNIITLNTVEGYELMYACNHIGAMFDFVSVASEEADLVRYLKDDEAKLVFVLDMFAPKALAAAKEVGIADRVIIIDLADEMPAPVATGYKAQSGINIDALLADPMVSRMADFRKEGQDLPKVEYHKDCHTPAVFAHTGGTTGFPKTVLLSDISYNGVAETYRRYMPFEIGEYVLNCTVPFVVYSNSVGMHMPLCAASAMQIIVPKFEPTEWPDYFRRYGKINSLVCVPAQLIPMMEDPRMDEIDLSCMQILGVGGDGCTTAFEEKFNAFLKAHGCKTTFIKGYGMTEVGAGASTTYPPNIVNVPDDVVVDAAGSVGLPHPINEFVIWDNDNDCECKYNEIGEITICSATEMLCYKGNEKATESIHRVHPNGKKYIHTGDLGYIDENGFLYISGRIKRIFITFQGGLGHKCFPAFTEEVLAMHPAVSQVCCVEMKNDPEHRLKAFVSTCDDSDISLDELKKELSQIAEDKLPPYQNPFVYEFRDELPLTPVGKVDYKVLEIGA